MSVCDIRLRLVIRRHAVPEVKLVWPCTATEDLTIAKLLVDIHEVVPLESGEWGLEDYAVELADGQGGSFECLHFQKVIKVLKEGDQVVYVNHCLRPRARLLMFSSAAFEHFRVRISGGDDSADAIRFRPTEATLSTA